MQHAPGASLVATMTPGAISPADTAWMLVATALVLLTTPALAFFYRGWSARRTCSSQG